MYLHSPLLVIKILIYESKVFRIPLINIVQSILLTLHRYTGPNVSSAVVYQIDFKGLLLML